MTKLHERNALLSSMTNEENQTTGRVVFRNVEDARANKGDGRVRRTRDKLGDALVALLLKKPFDDITVQDVLDGAGVSRATFYAHYRDKNDLFLSDVDDFFESIANALSRFGDKSKRVAPVEELFAHIGESRAFYDALVESGRLREVMELGEEHFGRGIEQRLSEIPSANAIPADQRGAIAHSLAGSLFSLLKWWVQHGMREPPAEMDKMFHRLAWSGVDRKL